MSRTNSSRTIEIGRGNFAYELEGEERNRGEVADGPNGHRRLAGDHVRGGGMVEHGGRVVQRGRRKKEVSRRTAASPRARRGRRRGVGWPGLTGVGPDGRRPRLTGRGRRRRLRLSRVDCLLGEVEELEAEPVAASSWLRVAGGGGVHDGGGGRMRGSTGGKLGLGKCRGSREQGGVRRSCTAAGGPPLDHHGGHGREARVVDTAAWWRQCLHCRHRGDAVFTDNPPPAFSFLFLFL